MFDIYERKEGSVRFNSVIYPISCKDIFQR